MADTENSLYRFLELLQRGFFKLIELILQTPAGKYIDLLRDIDDPGATTTGIGLGVLVVIVWKTESELVLLAIVITIFYIVHNAQQEKNSKSNVCPRCGKEFESHHGLKIHTGKKH